MTFDDLPPSAAWRHIGGRDGFEAVFLRATRRGWRFEGSTAAVEDGRPWSVRYVIAVDGQWRTRGAQVWTQTASGARHDVIRTDGSGRWEVNGEPAPHLDGCLDVDLEASACTNTFPIHRTATEDGGAHAAPAAYVRVFEAGVERLEQTYERRDDGAGGPAYEYAAPRFDFACRLVYDRCGLVVDYPGIAARLS